MAPQVALTMPILPGVDGVRRMGKSLGNYVGVTEPPEEQFGKTMSLPDDAMATWYSLLFPDQPPPAGHLGDAKRRLGRLVVSRFHDEDAAARGGGPLRPPPPRARGAGRGARGRRRPRPGAPAGAPGGRARARLPQRGPAPHRPGRPHPRRRAPAGPRHRCRRPRRARPAGGKTAFRPHSRTDDRSPPRRAGKCAADGGWPALTEARIAL